MKPDEGPTRPIEEDASVLETGIGRKKDIIRRITSEKEMKRFYREAIQRRTGLDVNQPAENQQETAKMQRMTIDTICRDIHERIYWGVYNGWGELQRITEIREIERLEESDAETFQKLYLHGLEHEPSVFGSTYAIESVKTPEQVAEWIGNNHVVGVKYNYKSDDGSTKERLAATAFLKREEGARSHIGMVGRLYVHPAHRRKQLSRDILLNLLDHARDIGIEQIEGWVTSTNTTAMDFYRKIGFRKNGPTRVGAVEISGTYYDWDPILLIMDEYRERRTDL